MLAHAQARGCSGTLAHTHEGVAAICAHVHVQMGCPEAGVHTGWVGDLSPWPGPAQATGWHQAADRGLGTPGLKNTFLMFLNTFLPVSKII